jgi:predicted nucleotidyltransferase
MFAVFRWPAHLEPEERRFLDALVGALLAAHGADIRKVVLYGSKARGDHGPYSDTDLLVITAGSVDLWGPLQEIAGDMEHEYGYPTVLSLQVCSEEEWEESGRMGSPFHSEVENEGLVAWQAR